MEGIEEEKKMERREEPVKNVKPRARKVRPCIDRLYRMLIVGR